MDDEGTARTPAPPAMYFPLGAVLVYGKDDVRPALDPECCHKACKCCLRVEDDSGWNVFLEKADVLLKETLPDTNSSRNMPTLSVVCEQDAQVELLRITKGRFGGTVVENLFTLQ